MVRLFETFKDARKAQIWPFCFCFSGDFLALFLALLKVILGFFFFFLKKNILSRLLKQIHDGEMDRWLGGEVLVKLRRKPELVVLAEDENLEVFFVFGGLFKRGVLLLLLLFILVVVVVAAVAAVAIFQKVATVAKIYIR